MAPAVELNCFPQFVRTSARQHIIEHESMPAAFWKMLRPSELGDSGMTMQALQQLQVEILSAK
eukprot:3720927-Lingulodinium_polyedra.AAC.1